MTMNVIPVIIPVYGRADFSAAAADDIRHQGHKVVCCNDSPDIVDTCLSLRVRA